MGLKNNRGPLVKWFSGFGFIKFEGRNVFVHRDAYLPGFETEIGQVGQMLGFDFGIAPNGKPPMAINVRVVKSAKAVADEKKTQAGLEALLKTKIDTLPGNTAVAGYEREGDVS